MLCVWFRWSERHLMLYVCVLDGRSATWCYICQVWQTTKLLLRLWWTSKLGTLTKFQCWRWKVCILLNWILIFLREKNVIQLEWTHTQKSYFRFDKIIFSLWYREKFKNKMFLYMEKAKKNINFVFELLEMKSVPSEMEIFPKYDWILNGTQPPPSPSQDVDLWPFWTFKLAHSQALLWIW